MKELSLKELKSLFVSTLPVVTTLSKGINNVKNELYDKQVNDLLDKCYRIGKLKNILAVLDKIIIALVVFTISLFLAFLILDMKEILTIGTYSVISLIVLNIVKLLSYGYYERKIIKYLETLNDCVIPLIEIMDNYVNECLELTEKEKETSGNEKN